MSSTIVHLALAGMFAAGLLGAYFDRRALLVVFAATAFPDLDSFIALVATVGHRAALHTFVVPAAVAAFWAYDTRFRGSSYVRDRWGAWGVRVGWVSLFAYAASGLGLDLVTGGINPFWPVHDQFYQLQGKIELSDQRGIIQTFVDVSELFPEDGGDAGSAGDGGGGGGMGSTEDVRMSTGVDPDPSGQSEDPERVFPIIRRGWEVVILVAGTVVTAARLRQAEHDEA